MAANETSLEALALQEHYANLVEELQNPDGIADKLFTQKIIDFQKLRKIHGGSSREEKNREVLDAVYNLVTFQDRAVFYTFVEILRARNCCSTVLLSDLTRGCEGMWTYV